MHLAEKNTCVTDCHNFRLNENSLTFLIVKSFVLYRNERRIKKNPIIFHAISFVLTTFLLRCISKYISSLHIGRLYNTIAYIDIVVIAFQI